MLRAENSHLFALRRDRTAIRAWASSSRLVSSLRVASETAVVRELMEVVDVAVETHELMELADSGEVEGAYVGGGGM